MRAHWFKLLDFIHDRVEDLKSLPVSTYFFLGILIVAIVTSCRAG
jgi:hypothetical protein